MSALQVDWTHTTTVDRDTGSKVFEDTGIQALLSIRESAGLKPTSVYVDPCLEEMSLLVLGVAQPFEGVSKLRM